MRTRWAEVIISKLVARDTYKVCSRVTDHASGLTNTVAVVAVIASNRTVFEASAFIACTVDAVAAPGKGTSIQVGLTGAGHTTWCDTLESAIGLFCFVCTRRTRIVGGKCVGWNTDEVRTRQPNYTRCLTDAVAVAAIISGNGTIGQTCALVAGAADGVITPAEVTRIQVGFACASDPTWRNTLECAVTLIHFVGTRWALSCTGECV